jgi:signal transduction histidine kinase
VTRLDDKTVTPSLTRDSTWERWDERVLAWTPWALMAVSVAITLVLSTSRVPDLAATLALAGLASAWVFLLYSRAPRPHVEHQVRMRVYLVGLIVLATLLMQREPFFFVFAITGFVQASLLRPWPLAVGAIAATSIAIHLSITGFPWPTVELWVLFVTVILIQTVAIGLGTVIGERLARISEERRQAVDRLEGAITENEGLHRQLVAQAREAGVLDERQRLAREIHDTLAHDLTAIVTQLEAALQSDETSADHRRHLELAVGLARDGLVEARRSVDAARPEALERATLPEALASAAGRWSELNEISVDVRTTGEPIALDPEIESALFRTAQEALANVAKHSGASRAGLTLSFMGDVVALDVRDDGSGFEVPDARARDERGFGLTAMRQRIERVAGTLTIESRPGAGTAVSARVPAIAAQTSWAPASASG